MSATDSDIVLTRSLSVENGGSSIIEYIVEMNDPSIDANYNPVSTYDGTSVTITINKLALSLTTGRIYNFRIIARNAIGDSEESNIISVALVS